MTMTTRLATSAASIRLSMERIISASEAVSAVFAILRNLTPKETA